MRSGNLLRLQSRRRGDLCNLHPGRIVHVRQENLDVPIRFGHSLGGFNALRFDPGIHGGLHLRSLGLKLVLVLDLLRLHLLFVLLDRRGDLRFLLLELKLLLMLRRRCLHLDLLDLRLRLRFPGVRIGGRLWTVQLVYGFIVCWAHLGAPDHGQHDFLHRLDRHGAALDSDSEPLRNRR